MCIDTCIYMQNINFTYAFSVTLCSLDVKRIEENTI